MLHYHGTPITPNKDALEIMKKRFAFVSYNNNSQTDLMFSICKGVSIDNGAFSFWKKDIVPDWEGYYKFVEKYMRYPNFNFAIIPDVIDGSEDDNDKLIMRWYSLFGKSVGVPVWHLHESFERLNRLANQFPMIAFGSSGDYSIVGNPDWWNRMSQALEIICIDGQPKCKIHGLRMLNVKIFTKIPFYSCDSTNVAQNKNIDCRWTGSYLPKNKALRGEIIAQNIEFYRSAERWTNDIVIQNNLF